MIEEIGREDEGCRVGNERLDEVHRWREEKEKTHGRAEAYDGDKEKGIVNVESLLIV